MVGYEEGDNRKSGGALPLKKILVVKLADIGDVLTAGPALRALRETYPAAEIDVLVTPGSAKVLEGLPLIDRLILFDKFRFDRSGSLLNLKEVRQAGRFLADLRSAKYDAIVIFHHLTTRWGAWKYALLALSTGARHRAGLDNGRGWFLNRRARDRGFGACHEVEYCLQTAATIGARTADVSAALTIAPEDDDFAAEFLAPLTKVESGAPLVAVHPGSGTYCLARRWPIERFAQVIDNLSEQGARFVLLGGPDEVDLVGRLDQLSAAPTLNLAGKTTIKQLAAVLRRCHLFVGNDSGVMHLAAAAGTPVIAVFGPSNHRAWGPFAGWPSRFEADLKVALDRGSTLGEVPKALSHAVVRVDRPCSPCLYRGYQLGRREGCPEIDCLKEVTAEMVLSVARPTLERLRSMFTNERPGYTIGGQA